MKKTVATILLSSLILSGCGTKREDTKAVHTESKTIEEKENKPKDFGMVFDGFKANWIENSYDTGINDFPSDELEETYNDSETDYYSSIFDDYMLLNVNSDIKTENVYSAEIILPPVDLINTAYYDDYVKTVKNLILSLNQEDVNENQIIEKLGLASDWTEVPNEEQKLVKNGIEYLLYTDKKRRTHVVVSVEGRRGEFSDRVVAGTVH